MVFRKKARRYLRSFGKKARSRSRSGGDNATSLLLAGGAYGVARGYITNLINPFTSKMGQYGTPLALGVLGYYLSKKTSGFTKDAGKAILAVEAANLSSNAFASSVPQSSSSSTVYGGWQ